MTKASVVVIISILLFSGCFGTGYDTKERNYGLSPNRGQRNLQKRNQNLGAHTGGDNSDANVRQHTLKPTGKKSINEHTIEYAYNTHMPELRSKGGPTEAKQAELRFQLIPRKCQSPVKVTFTVQKKQTTLETGACHAKVIQSIKVHIKIPAEPRTLFSLSCKDCLSKGVNYSDPFLSFVSEIHYPRPSARRNHPDKSLLSRKAYPGDEDSTSCRRVPLIYNFLTSYDLAYVRGRYGEEFVDIGRCEGKCDSLYNTLNEHSRMHFTLTFNNLTDKTMCCAPIHLEDYHLTSQSGVNFTWTSALVTDCVCK